MLELIRQGCPLLAHEDRMERRASRPSAGRGRQLLHQQDEWRQGSLGDLDGSQYVLQHLVWRHAFEVGFRLQHDAMAEDWQHRLLYIVGNDIVAAIHSRNGFGKNHQAHCRPWARSERKRGPRARAPHQLHDISEERFLNFHSSDLLPGVLQQLRINRTESRALQIMRVESVLDVREQVNFFARFRIEHANLHQEAIELRFWEGIRALEIHRVLRGKYGEEWGEIVARAINR